MQDFNIIDESSKIFGGKTKMGEAMGVRYFCVNYWEKNGLPLARHQQLIEAAENHLRQSQEILEKIKKQIAS